MWWKKSKFRCGGEANLIDYENKFHVFIKKFWWCIFNIINIFDNLISIENNKFGLKSAIEIFYIFSLVHRVWTDYIINS